VWRDFTSSISQKLDNGQTQQLNDAWLTNNTQYRFADFFGGVYYKLLLGRMIFRPGLSLHYYNLRDKQQVDIKQQEKWYLLPEFKMKWRFKNRSSISLSYNLTNSYSDVKKYAQAYIINSFNSLQGGKRDLKNVLQHQVSFRYSAFNMYKFRYVFASLTYNKSLQDIRTKTNLLLTDMVSVPVNLNHVNKNINAYLSYGKRYTYWKYRLNTNLNWSNFYSIINNQEVQSNSITQSYKAEINLNLDGFFNFDIGYNLSISHFVNNLRKSLYYTHKPYAGIELRLFKETTQINLKYDYYNYYNNDNTVYNRYGFLMAEIFYQKEGSSWEFSLKGSNLLNTTNLDKESLTDLYLATSRYYVMPAYWLFKVSYKL